MSQITEKLSSSMSNTNEISHPNSENFENEFENSTLLQRNQFLLLVHDSLILLEWKYQKKKRVFFLS